MLLQNSRLHYKHSFRAGALNVYRSRSITRVRDDQFSYSTAPDLFNDGKSMLLVVANEHVLLSSYSILGVSCVLYPIPCDV